MAGRQLAHLGSRGHEGHPAAEAHRVLHDRISRRRRTAATRTGRRGTSSRRCAGRGPRTLPGRVGAVVEHTQEDGQVIGQLTQTSLPQDVGVDNPSRVRNAGPLPKGPGGAPSSPTALASDSECCNDRHHAISVPRSTSTRLTAAETCGGHVVVVRPRLIWSSPSPARRAPSLIPAKSSRPTAAIMSCPPSVRPLFATPASASYRALAWAIVSVTADVAAPSGAEPPSLASVPPAQPASTPTSSNAPVIILRTSTPTRSAIGDHIIRAVGDLPWGVITRVREAPLALPGSTAGRAHHH